MLILVLVLRDSLRTYFKSLFLFWSLGVRSFPCPCPCGSGPCPCPGPCGLVFVLVLVFSPCKDLFPLFHYSGLFAEYDIVVLMHTNSVNYTYLCLSCRHLALRL